MMFVTYTQCRRFLLLYGWASQTLWHFCSSQTAKEKTCFYFVDFFVFILVLYFPPHVSKWHLKCVQWRETATFHSECLTVTANSSVWPDISARDVVNGQSASNTPWVHGDVGTRSRIRLHQGITRWRRPLMRLAANGDETKVERIFSEASLACIPSEPLQKAVALH